MRPRSPSNPPDEGAPSPGITRRRFLLVSGAAALALRRPVLRDAAGLKGPGFGFVAFNDTHVRDARCVRFLRKAFGEIRKLAEAGRADLAILSGDVAYDGRPKEYALWAEAARALTIPLYVTPGNHDYRGRDRSAYDRAFPGTANYRFEHKGWQFVGFDSTDGPRYLRVAVRPPTLAWLGTELGKMSRTKPLVAFTHFPLGEGVRMRSRNAEEVLRRFAGHNLRHVLSGHFHGSTERRWRGAVLTTNRCLAVSRGNHDGSRERGFLHFTVSGGKLAYRFVEVKP